MTSPEPFYRNLEEVLGHNPGTIKGIEKLTDINWDSMAVVLFLAMADEKYSIAISPSKMADASTVSDLYALIAPAA